MTDYFDKLYTSFQNDRGFLKLIRYYSFMRFSIRIIANIVLPIYFTLSQKNKKYALSFVDNKQIRIIVSLTSFPSRISRLWIVIETILRQTKKPDKIILWVSNEQFKTINSLPSKLLMQQKRGLEIILVEGDIRSHKKYFYALKSYPNDNIVLIDDDIFYRTDMIEDLYSYSIKYPSVIISQYSSKVKWSKSELLPYKKWPRIVEETGPSTQLFYGTGGGTFIPPGVLHRDVTNIDLFSTLTPTADDIWLNTMSRLKETKVIKTKYYSLLLPVLSFKSISLSLINNNLNQNDVQISQIRKYYQKEYSIDPFAIEDID